jgi:hypothetical protein
MLHGRADTDRRDQRGGYSEAPPPAQPNEVAMDQSLRLLTLQFLDWVAVRPRTYAEAMDAWRTSCPRLPAWEDAVDHGLVVVEAAPGQAMGQAAVRLTQLGEAVRASQRVSA